MSCSGHCFLQTSGRTSDGKKCLSTCQNQFDTVINMVRLKEHKANELPAGAALIFGIGLKKKSLSLTCVKMP